MPASGPEAVAIAEAVTIVAEAVRGAKYLADQVLANNSAHAVDWNDPAIIQALEDAGKQFTAAEIANAIGSLSTFKTTFWDAGHGGNFELLSRPII